MLLLWPQNFVLVFSVGTESTVPLEGIHPYIALVAVLLGMVAVGIAYKQFSDSRQLIKEARDITQNAMSLTTRVQGVARRSEELVGKTGDVISRTELVANAISTKYLGVFPLGFPVIAELIGNASRTVDIMVDSVAYGHYRAPEQFSIYLGRVREAASDRKVIIRMLVYSPRLKEKVRDEGFRGAEHFEETRRSLFFQRYFEEWHRGARKPGNYADFLRTLALSEQSYEAEVQNSGVKILRSEEAFQVFLWLVDDEEAAFSFPIHGEPAEIGFHTRDASLLRTFSQLFRRTWANNELRSPEAARGFKDAAEESDDNLENTGSG